MGQSVSSQHETREAQETLRRERQSESGFKPLALPALAAAVQMSKQSARRPEAQRQVPAILRLEALGE